MPSAKATTLYIKVTKPTTKIEFEEKKSFERIKIVDVKGIDSCIIYFSPVWKPWTLSNIDEVYPGDEVFLEEKDVLGIYPSPFDNNVDGYSKEVNEVYLRITNLDGSEPEFKTPIILTIRSVPSKKK